MSIKIDWSPMAVDTLTLYYSDSAFTSATLPGTNVVLDPAAVTYTDTTVPDRSVRYYMLEAVKAGANTQYSQCMLHGNFSKTGPGGSVVLRGDWNAGYMGFVPVAQLFTISGLRTALSITNQLGTAPADNTMTGWYKFVYKGKILFFPNNVCSTAGTSTWSQIYNLGLAYGVDGPGAAPFNLVTAGAQPAITATVNQKKVVTVGTDSFLVRLPKNSTLPTDQNVADRTSFVGSEWWSTMAMLAAAVADPLDLAVFPTIRWNDIAGVPYPLAAVQHFQSIGNLAVSNANWTGIFPRNINITASGAWVSWVPVLELIPA
jgi:hypothetical protein